MAANTAVAVKSRKPSLLGRSPSLLGRFLRTMVLWPFKMLWRFASRVEKRTGIVVTLVLGATLVIVGWWLIGTFLGLPLGLLMVLTGGALLLRSLY